MMGLTRKQQETFHFIAEHIRHTGLAPTMEELAKGVHVVSKGRVHEMVNALVERGYLRRIPHRARALEVIAQAQPLRLRPELDAAVTRYIAQEGISRETFMNECVRAYLGEAA